MKTKKICLHCERKNAGRPRGLCNKCYSDTEIRRLYPSGNPWENDGESTDDMTEAELDAMIAKERPGMPGRYGGDDAECERSSGIRYIQCDRRWNGKIFI